MKITLTKDQIEELTRNALAVKQEAERVYNDANKRYNEVSKLSAYTPIDLVRLLELSTGLPDKAPAVQPVSVTYPSMTKRYFAYSRTNRRDDKGALSVHDIKTWSRYGGGVDAECTCPGFINHGHCWASTEAILQYKDEKRRSGTGSVYRRTL